MKSETLIALGILFLVVCGCLSHTLLENFRGGGGRRGGGRRGGGGRREAEAEDICIDLGGVITEDGIDDLYCGVTGMLGLACLLIGLYHVIASEVVQRMDVLFPEQD